MSSIVANGSDKERPGGGGRDGGTEERRARARRNALLLALLAVALYVGFIMFGWFEGIFPG